MAVVLLERFPETRLVADPIPVTFRQVGSTEIGPNAWVELRGLIHRIARDDPAVAGFVIPHGTATLEETAFFLNLTLAVAQPVVLVGAQRPASALGTDAGMNLVNGAAAARRLVNFAPTREGAVRSLDGLLRKWAIALRRSANSSVAVRRCKPCSTCLLQKRPPQFTKQSGWNSPQLMPPMISEERRGDEPGEGAEARPPAVLPVEWEIRKHSEPAAAPLYDPAREPRREPSIAVLPFAETSPATRPIILLPRG